jgi:hypothetical protein
MAAPRRWSVRTSSWLTTSLPRDRSMGNLFPGTGDPLCVWLSSLGRADWSDPGMRCLELAVCALLSPRETERSVASAWQACTS